MSRKDAYTSVFLKAGNKEHDKESVKDQKKIWWYSTRDKSSGGLRITDACLEFIETQAQIKTYAIELPKELTIGPQIIIWLDQYIDTPWHLEKRILKVLSEKTAFELYLFSGDVKKYGIARTMAARINQN